MTTTCAPDCKEYPDRMLTMFAYMQGVQLDTERKAEWSQSVRVDAKQQLREVPAGAREDTGRDQRVT